MSQLSPNLIHGFLSTFVVASPRPYVEAICLFVYLFFIFLRIVFVFVNMGPYGSENFETPLLLQIAVEIFETFPEFFLTDLVKRRLGLLKFEN